MSGWLDKHPCSRCQAECFRICYIGHRLVCVDCFAAHAKAAAAGSAGNTDRQETV